MSRRDVRDPFVIYTAKDGFTMHPFQVAPMSMNDRCGAGYYVMVPVLNEQAGYELIADMKRRAVQPGREP